MILAFWIASEAFAFVHVKRGLRSIAAHRASEWQYTPLAQVRPRPRPRQRDTQAGRWEVALFHCIPL